MRRPGPGGVTRAAKRDRARPSLCSGTSLDSPAGFAPDKGSVSWRGKTSDRFRQILLCSWPSQQELRRLSVSAAFGVHWLWHKGCFDPKHEPSAHSQRRRSGPQEDRQGGPREAGSDRDRGARRSGWSDCCDRARIPRQRCRAKCGRHDGPRSAGRLESSPQSDEAVGPL